MKNVISREMSIQIKGLQGSTRTKKMAKLVAAILYFGIARYLPVSYSPLSLGLTRRFRAILCRIMFNKCGNNLQVEQGVWLGFGSNIEIGDFTYIGSHSRLYSGGGIIIGDNVMIAEDVVILTLNHKHSDITIPMAKQGYESAPVEIQDDVWIGMRVIVLPGVKIGRSSIVGAGAVVTRDIPPFSVAVGNPAKVIKKRDGNIDEARHVLPS